MDSYRTAIRGMNWCNVVNIMNVTVSVLTHTIVLPNVDCEPLYYICVPKE